MKLNCQRSGSKSDGGTDGSRMPGNVFLTTNNSIVISVNCAGKQHFSERYWFQKRLIGILQKRRDISSLNAIQLSAAERGCTPGAVHHEVGLM